MIATNNGAYPWRGNPTGETLEKARAAWRRGERAIDEVRLIEDRATREAIEAQVAAGLALVTDGLVRREDPVGYLVSRLEGARAGEVRPGFPGSGVSYATPVVESEISWKAPILLEDFLFAREGSAAPVKTVLTGPYTLARLADDHTYGDPQTLAMALATALNQELRALQSAGAECVQIDEPALLSHKADFPFFTRIWDVLGRSITMTLCLHLQGGALDGLYPGIAHLRRMRSLSIDCVAGRENLSLLRATPPPAGLEIVLGVVGDVDSAPESAQDLVSLVDGLKGLPPHDRLMLGTAADLGRLSQQTARAKLGALAQAARLLSSGAGPA